METVVPKKLSIKHNDFVFNIEFHDDIVRIEALHESEYLLWGHSFDKSIESSNKNNNLTITLSPKMIYDLLNDYANNKSDKYVTITFPEKYKTPDDAIFIEVKIVLPYGTACEDSKVLILEPIKITTEERFNKKIAFNKADIMAHIESLEKRLVQMIIDANEKSNKDLTAIMTAIDKHHNTTYSNLVTKIGIDMATLKTELLTKITTDIAALETKFNAKISTDITALETKLAANMATIKADIINKMTAETTRVNTELTKYALK